MSCDEFELQWRDSSSLSVNCPRMESERRLLSVATIVVKVANMVATMFVEVATMVATFATFVMLNQQKLNDDPYDYCPSYYTKEAMIAAYKKLVYVVGNKDTWKVPEDIKVRTMYPQKAE
ncbi:hypothetical protein POM88_049406 [Heracleum sosnowskyi]|uniref:Uncharacterized protein n=1 Tax=Heracleum sosnowskyi TaxID=360622 RepID=A0AAD8GVI6_9APIA|nr:hypothetical protein POM88_049406 [Heracleum sosnowskyi]